MKALIAMSGGVDSSVAAYLTKESGYDCIGCTMKLYNNSDIGVERSRTCCSLDDVEDARSVAYKLGIPYYVFNFTDDFGKKVIDKFVHSYENGKTPNPCIDCNRHMKFDKLYERALILGCDKIVTGHYARVENTDGRFILKKAVDESKDQSYMLYSMTQNQLAHTLFPLGELHKTSVRDIAHKQSFNNAAKPDSQDICFVPNGNYASFLEFYTGKHYPEGNFISTDGKLLGRHKGVIRYTVGQRKGLGLPSDEPWYVKKILVKDNLVVLCRENELYEREFSATDFNWISNEPPTSDIRCKARIRYRQKEQNATVHKITEDSARILFDEPQRAITPGQAVVLYSDDEVLGGGIIDI